MGIGAQLLMADRSYRQSKQHHSKSIDLSKRQHLMETFSELAQHFIQLDADLINATKESERDVYDQRNQQLQTLILSCTVMFGALSTIMVQGSLADASPKGMVILFSIVNGLSFACLVGCLVLCIEILSLTSRFMICKANFQGSAVKQARENTHDIFRKLHAKDFHLPRKEYQHYEPLAVDDSEEKLGMQHNTHNLSSMSSSRIETLWRELEEGSTSILNDRRKLIGRMVESESFDNFWRKHCDDDRVKAVFCFYCGTVLMLFSINIYIYSQFVYIYDSRSSALIGMAIIVFSIIWGFIERYNITRLRPEAFFFQKGDFVDVAMNNSFLRIQYWSSSCDWRRCRVLTVPTGTQLDETMEVEEYAGENGGGAQHQVFAWQVTGIFSPEPMTPQSPQGNHNNGEGPATLV